MQVLLRPARLPACRQHAIDHTGRAAAEFDAIAVERDDRENRTLVGPQPVERLEGNLERKLTLSVLRHDVGGFAANVLADARRAEGSISRISSAQRTSSSCAAP